jgi:GNAT superfamily N-acetyltransferase
MKAIQKPWLKFKEAIDQQDYDLIHGLEALCVQEEHTALKLELDYKLGVTLTHGKAESARNVNEFLYFDGEELIGYIGICGFGQPVEINGMVHPAYRRQGVFSALFSWVRAELDRRNAPGALLLCDRNNAAGQAFIQKTGAVIEHSEYEMYLKREAQRQHTGAIILRKAVNGDVREIARQNSIYFGDREEEPPHENRPLPEEEEKRGMTIYLAELDKQVIGKIHLNYWPASAGSTVWACCRNTVAAGSGGSCCLKA